MQTYMKTAEVIVNDLCSSLSPKSVNS